MTYRLDLILSLNNKYDYNEFIQKCKELNIPQITWYEYATKVSMLDYAMCINPEMEPMDAYMDALQAHGNILQVPKYTDNNGTITVTYQDSGCGSCGGGQVR